MDTVMQAGAICCKSENGVPRVLLVRSKKQPEHWIFPKGHIEKGENASQAAVRELREEGGIEGIARSQANTLGYVLNGLEYQVTYYLIDFVKKAGNGEKGRDPGWFTIDEAIGYLSFSDLKNMLAEHRHSIEFAH